MENYESELFMSQEGYASIDFTLLDRPNNNITSAPEATAALLPDVHVADTSFSSFPFIDGSGGDGLNGFPHGGRENQALEHSRDDPEEEMYKERTVQSNAENGVAAPSADYAEYHMPQSVPKPVSNVDFFAKNQALVQQEPQSQLSLFGNDGAEDNQDYFEPGQASQQSQSTGNSWWTPENSWLANNNQRDQSQVYNQPAVTEDQRRLMQMKQMKGGRSQTSSQAEYTGALYSMPQAVNSDPTPSMYSFLPTNTNRPHRMSQTADPGLNLSRVQAVQSSTSVKNPQYDFQGLLNGAGYQQGGAVAQNMSLPEQHRYRAMAQEASSREDLIRMQAQQAQSLNRYEGQNMMEGSPLKVSDYDFSGGDYVLKGQPQAEIGHQLEQADAQVWRQQQPVARHQSHQLNSYPSNAYAELHQHQQAQVRQRLQQHAQHQHFYGGNQSQASGNQFQAFLSEGSLQDLPQVMQQQPERANPQQMGMDSQHPLLQANYQAVNQNNSGNVMYPSNEAGQGPAIGYLLGQDNSFSWQQLAMKASGMDQSPYASAPTSGRLGQQTNPYAHSHGGATAGFTGGMGKHPAASPQINRPIPRNLGAGSSSLFGRESRPEAADHQANKAKMLFGQAMQQQQQQQQQQPQAVKHMQGFPGNLHPNNYSMATQQSVEDAQRRQQQSLRGNSVQQDGTPQVKLFAQSLTSLDPMQQQQRNPMAANRSSQHQQARPLTAIQQPSLDMLQARNPNLGASPAHYYQQGANQAGGSFLQNASNAKQRPMWSNYDLEPDASQVEGPVQKSNNWNGEGEAQARAENEGSLLFGRPNSQQNIWGGHGMQQTSSQASGDLDTRHRSMQSGRDIQPAGGHSLANQPNGSTLHQNSLDLAELENGRQQEMQNPQQESNWRDHSSLQTSPQQSAATNSSLQAFTEVDRAQNSWKSLLQGVNPGNSGQLAEAEKEQQSALWGQNSSHVAGSLPLLPNGPNSRLAQSGWSGAQGSLQTEPVPSSGEREQQTQHLPRNKTQFMLPAGSSQPAQGFQDVDGRQQLGNHGPSFREALSHASLSDNDPSSASGHMEQSYQRGGSFPPSVDRDGNQNNQNSSDPVGGSSSGRDAIHFSYLSAEHQANLQHHGRNNAWSSLGTTSDSRQSLDDTAIQTLDSGDLRQQHQEGSVQLQLSNHQTENRFSPLMNARAASFQEESPGVQSLRTVNALAGYRHQSDMERSGLPSGASEEALTAWAQRQMSAGQMQTEQSKLGGRALQTSSAAVSVGRDQFTPQRPESTVEQHSSYNDGMLAQRARYQSTRGDPKDATEHGRNTLELLNRPEQGEKSAENVEDQEGGAMEDGGPSSGISLAHLRQGAMGTLLQRPTPSRPESLSRNQLDLQLSRNMEGGWPQGRNLAHDFTEEARLYAQAQMSAQNMRAVQMHSESTPSNQGQMAERMNMNAVFHGANRHLPSDISRQAAHIYKNLSAAAKIRFAHQLAQQNQRANAATQSMDPSHMSSFVGPRIALQQQLSSVGMPAGYPERAAMPAGPSSDMPTAAATVMASAATGQLGYKWSGDQSGAAQQLKQGAPVEPPHKKQKKEYPPLVPWRVTITQAATNLPNTIRSEMEWAAATNCLPDQERLNDAVETLDITAMCVKRARRRLKFTTQLMQQLIPALPCQLFKGNSLEDHKSASFVLAKFAVSEACWLATGAVREPSGAVASEDGGGDSNGNHTSETEAQQVAVVKQSRPVTLSSKLRIQLKQRMTELHDELLRLESGPSAMKLCMDLHNLDKLGVMKRMAKVHGSAFLAGVSNPTGSPRGRQEVRLEASGMYSSQNAFTERYVAAVSFSGGIPENCMLFPL